MKQFWTQNKKIPPQCHRPWSALKVITTSWGGNTINVKVHKYQYTHKSHEKMQEKKSDEENTCLQKCRTARKTPIYAWWEFPKSKIDKSLGRRLQVTVIRAENVSELKKDRNPQNERAPQVFHGIKVNRYLDTPQESEISRTVRES